jgi:hypothetical protein
VVIDQWVCFASMDGLGNVFHSDELFRCRKFIKSFTKTDSMSYSILANEVFER